MPTSSPAAQLLTKRQHSGPRPRPRFDVLVDLDPATAQRRLQTAVESSEIVRGIALEGHRFEIVLKDGGTIWAPQLDVKILAEDAGTKIMGRFGPNSQVWLTYLALYMLSAFAAVALAVYGVTQWLLGGSLWGVYVTPFAFLAAGLVYGASYVGQGLATAEMYVLREFLEDAVAVATPIAEGGETSPSPGDASPAT